MIDRLSFVLGEALVALRRNGFMTLAAITTVAVSLYLLGGLGYVYLRFNEYAQKLPSRFEMRVYVKDQTPAARIPAIAKQIRAIEGVSEATYIPRDKAWERLKKEDPITTQGLENPLRDAFKVRVGELNKGDQVAESLKRLKDVASDGVRYLKEEQNLAEQLLLILRWVGSVLGGLLFITAGILIGNAIQLTVWARRTEVRIMQLVGASHAMIRLPFYVEGVLQGVLGGVLAACLLAATQSVIQTRLLEINVAFKLATFPLEAAVGFLGALGGGYGLLCSVIALRRASKRSP